MYKVMQVGGRGWSRPVNRQRVVVMQQPSLQLPGFMSRLRVLCDGHGGAHHPLPVQCQFHGPAVSQSGHLVARYDCPLCGQRLFWGISHQTGRPFCVWTEK